MSTIAKSSLIVTIFTVLGMGLAFFSQIVIAAKFGAGKDMDIFLAATTLPLFIISILSGALNFTFIPVFAEYRAKNIKEFWKTVSSFINLAGVATAGLCIIGIIMAGPIMKALTPGFNQGKLAQSAELMQWLFPIIIFTVFNELMASVYYSNQRFVVPSLNKIISPLLIMTYVLLFHSFLSTKSIILAMLTAAVIQTALLILGFFRTADFHYSLVLDYKNSGVRKIIKLMTPLIVGMIIYRAVPIVDRFFLSRLPDGSISHVGYAMQLMSVLLPLIVSGISVSIFPIMSKYAAERNWNALKEIMTKGVRMVFFLSIPFVVLLGAYGKSIIQLFLERGAFTPADTTAVYYAFAIYLLALPAGVIGSIVSQGFYALQQNQTIALIGIIMMMLYIVLCLFFVKFLAYLAIPFAYAIYHNCAILTTTNVLKRKMEQVTWLPIIPFLSKSTIAALIAAFLIYPAVKFERDDILAVNILCVIGFVIYFLINKFVFNLEEPEFIWQAVFVSKKKG